MPSCFARAFPLLGFCAVVFAQTTPSTASQTGIVEGDVTDSVTHKPIAGARVMLQADKGVLFTRCDGNGRFQFQPVPLGDGLVLADQAGYVGISQPPIPARLSPGKTRTQVHSLLQPYGVISGRITDPAGVLKEAVENVRPALEVKSRRVGGANYQVPMAVGRKRQQSLAIRWLLEAARAKSGKSMQERLAEQLIAASRKEGDAMTTRENVHKMAEANKAFAHYARF